MGFQVSVTHWFLLTPFCHGAAVLSPGGLGAAGRMGQELEGSREGRQESCGARCGCRELSGYRELSGLASGLRTGSWSGQSVREGAALDSEDTGCPLSPTGLTTVPKPGPR